MHKGCLEEKKGREGNFPPLTRSSREGDGEGGWKGGEVEGLLSIS